jgi:hypothetical protein
MFQDHVLFAHFILHCPILAILHLFITIKPFIPLIYRVIYAIETQLHVMQYGFYEKYKRELEGTIEHQAQGIVIMRTGERMTHQCRALCQRVAR